MYHSLAPAAEIEPLPNQRAALRRRLMLAASVFVDEFLLGLDRFPLDGEVNVQSNWVYDEADADRPYEFQFALTMLQDGDFE